MRARRAKWAGTGSEPELQAASKRSAVIAAAANLFNERGFHLTTLDDVAAELNVTKAGLYYYIKDKDEILRECYRLALLGLSDSLIEVRNDELPIIVRLREFLLSFGRVMSTDYGKCLVRTGIRQLRPESRDVLMPLVRDLESALLDLIEQGIREGLFRSASPKLIRNFMFGAFQEIAVWHNKEGDMNIEEIVENYTDFLLGGISMDSNK